MRKNIVSIVAASLLTSVLVACGGGGGGGTPAPTNVTVTCPNGTSKTAATLDAANALCPAPTTQSISPSTAATGVSVDTFASVDVTTDSTVDATSITATNITLKAGLTAVPGTVSAVGTKGFKFTPTGKLNFGQQYKFSASVKDALGRTLTVNSTFTTALISCVAPQIPNSTGDACLVSQELACAVTSHSYGDIPIPAGYLGAYPVPTPKAKLSSSTTKIIELKDYYPGYLGLPNGCTDRTLFARNTYMETLDRIKMDGADEVNFTNYGPWDDITKPIFSISKSNYQIPESEVIFLATEAKKRNLRINMYWQYYFSDVKGNVAPSTDSPDFATFFTRAMDTWQIQVKELASVSKQAGIDGLYVDFANYIPDFSNQPYWQYYIDKMLEITTDVKAVYSGKILYGQLDGTAIDSRFVGKVDYIRIPLRFYDSAPVASVAWLKNKYDQQIQSLYSDTPLGKLGIPISFYLFIRSQDNALTVGFVEDGFCVGATTCEQITAIPDFSIQAVVYEAMFESIGSQSYFNNYQVGAGSYWLTDDITPTKYGKRYSVPSMDEYDFPNISPSFRNKPAEGIVRYWFGR